MQLPDSILMFKPSILQSMRGYNRERFIKDVTAGLTVGVVALPLAMAFAIASGLTPQTGIFTAIIAGFLIALFGGSKVQIGGPAGAFIVIVYGIVERYGVPSLIIATAMSGVLLFLMGLFRMGTLVRFIPVAVVIGFTNGIAVLIGLSQLKDFLGLSIPKLPADFFGMLSTLWAYQSTFNPYALAVSVGSLLTIIVWQHFLPALGPRTPLVHGKLTIIPGSIVALILGSIAVTTLNLPVETIGSRFGGIPAELPAFALPELNWETARFLFIPALTLAILGAIESLLCARVADGMVDERHDPNQELMAQGTANFITPFFGGMPATGTIARTVTNVKSGASSPIAGMVHALVLLLIVLVAAPLAALVPLPTLAAVLMFVAWNMGEWREFARLRSYRMPYRLTLLAVFFLTVVFDLTVAVEVGLVAACLTFIYRISSLSRSEPLVPPAAVSGAPQWNDSDLRVWRLYGALFFGAVKLIEDIEDHLPRHVAIVDLKNVIYLDSSGAEEMQHLARACQKRNITLILCGVIEQPLDMARRARLLDHPGVRQEPDLRAALAAGLALLPPGADNGPAPATAASPAA
ncbi:SulP family inorganic anion transporter [Brachymonas denitrificans]|uniref:SulP family inorganic anion transporter n=1 Tax=Brachymonas denitrificans TaxID=28220 RepID=UPI001BCAFAFE|nr:SulP family inorganic anion transporter [Brachymonas denitrificans]